MTRSYRNEKGMFIVNPTDDSPRHSYYPTGYDARCSACWLNHSHSEEFHKECIKERIAS